MSDDSNCTWFIGFGVLRPILLSSKHGENFPTRVGAQLLESGDIQLCDHEVTVARAVISRLFLERIIMQCIGISALSAAKRDCKM